MKSLNRPLSALSLAAGLWLCLSAPSLHAQASLSLNGDTQYVEVPANTNLTPTNITLEAWVNIPASGTLTIASRGNGGTVATDYIFEIGDANYGAGTFVTLFGGGAWGISTSKISTNIWTHVAVTYNGTNKLFYINGILGGTTNQPGQLYSGDSATSPFYIGLQGQECQCNPFDGEIAEVRLWDTVRSESQIQADMNYSSGSQSGLVAYYHLNEGSGTTANDASGNAHTGTLENGASWSSSGPPPVSFVTNAADSGTGTLRSAITDAVNGQVIYFATNLSGATITLASTLTINTSLTIDASALPGGIRINGNDSVVVFKVPSDNVTDVLNSLTITNGYSGSYGYGGGIYNEGALTLNQCTLLNNNAQYGGGGIQNEGALTLNECTLFGNNAETEYGAGGGIYNDSGAALTLNECTLSGNSAPDYGGGIDNDGTATLDDCTLSGNSTSYYGGGFYNDGTLTLNQCTLSGNSAQYDGSGIIDVGTLSLTNTIVAGNNASDYGSDIYVDGSVLTYGGSNLVQNVYNDNGTINGPAPLDTAPALASLGNYGGPTQTMPPLPGSPAIGEGSVAANTFATDQRGYPRTQNGLIDLGAVELPTVQPFTATPTNGAAPLAVQFDPANADSEGFAIVGWNWSFGDGYFSTNQNPTHVYNTIDMYSPVLVVTNSQGLTLGVSGPAITVHAWVTSAADSGPGTLRSAINNVTNGEMITFATNLSGATITLAGTLAINTNLTIDASALPGGIQINGNRTVTVFDVASNTTVILRSLTITNGFTSGTGGGINNNGTLTLTNCTLSGNSATNGGSIYINEGTVILDNCTLSGNSATSSGYDGGGGGIYINEGTMTLDNCILSGNSATGSGYGDGGGGIFICYGMVTLNQCTLSKNSADYEGGGIYINTTNLGTVTLNQCTLAGNNANLAGGGIHLDTDNQSAVILNQCTLSGNGANYEGGGIDNPNYDGNGSLTLNQCTLSGNSATNTSSQGGGIYNESIATLNQCTLWGNSAYEGGGINTYGYDGIRLILNGCTLSGNDATNGYGGGIYLYGSTANITNTIVAGNIGAYGPDIFNDESAVTNGGSNLIESETNYGGTTNGPAALTNAPDLGPLGNYGGPTQTMPPLPGSPAIGAGSTNANTFTTDQRGFPRTQNGRIDIGAVELPVVQPFTASPNDGMAPLNVQFNSTSVDSDGSPIVEWDWSFGDGNAGTNQNPTNVYSGGIFLPSLIVTNSLGLVLAASGPTIYATPLVTSNADNGPGTLRFAIANVFGGETITIATNLSGATISLAGTLTIKTNLTIDASALPGGLQINGNKSVLIFDVASNATVILNSLTITNGFSGNGGGIGNNGTLTLNQCTLSGNSGTNGGGIYNDAGTITLNECTLSGNSAKVFGGGIYNVGTLNNAGTLSLNQCTLSGNSAGDYGGGILNGDRLAVANSIVAGNSGSYGADICNEGLLTEAALTYGGSNLVQSVGNLDGTINGPTPLDAAPDLNRLGNYGGPTQTMPPLPGSPAIGAGSVAANTFTTDQRGYARMQNGRIDLGAVELPTMASFSASPTNDWQPNRVQFNVPGMDSDGSAIAGWKWSFGDGSISTTQNPAHAYAATGNFSPSLIVTNNLGLTLTASGPAISVYSPLAITGISWSENNLTLSGTNGVSGVTYTVLASTNLALPLSQWTPMSTNTWNASGAFTLTLTNTLNPPAPQQFYLLTVP